MRRKYIANYRGIYEKHYRCCILPGFQVHHKDFNYLNNDPLNLEVLTLEEHALVHELAGQTQVAAFIRGQISHKEMIRQGGIKGGRKTWELHKDEIIIRFIECGKKMGPINGKKNVESGQIKRWAAAGGKVGGKVTAEKRRLSGEYKTDRWKELIKLANRASILAGAQSIAGKVGGKMPWWVNVIENKSTRSHECPGEDWIRGRKRWKQIHLNQNNTCLRP